MISVCLDAEQEAMVATKRRDWAFSEIDKTVQERESIRTLCDNLRRDRDRAVSELAKALRNSDECEKQKNDAVKELKEIRLVLMRNWLRFLFSRSMLFISEINEYH